MSRESLVILAGIITVATPYLGLPSEWKGWVFLVTGIILIILGYSLRRSAFFRSIEVIPGERRSEAFVEHDTPERSETRQTSVQ